jgi:hypothetical protein
MFPVTRQVRRKRTPFSAGQVASAGALMRVRRAEEHAHRSGSGGKQRGLGEEARLGSGNVRLGSG